ncbi:MAG: glycine zipper 2TM domain-containing protein [Rhodocyclales bacterium]|nr:glycine zipper 2TM domain-containing protein [Rhodocyclales bacterium]
MENVSKAASSPSLHPVLWVAGISVTVLSLAGIAALTGLLPLKSASAPERQAIVTTAPAVEPPVAPVVPSSAPVVAPPASTVPVSKTLPAIHHKTEKKKVAQDVPANPPAVPPPLASGVPPDYVPPAPSAAPVPPAPLPCADCGVIANVRQVTNEGQGTGAGAIIGGLAGGALASNVGRGNTRTLATIAGAVGGGMLGNSIEKSQHRTTSYQVTVRMEDGTTRTVAADTMPSWRIGDKVKLTSGTIVSR